MSSSRLVIAALSLVATAACTDTNSATNLHPDGPPKVEQVRLWEDFTDSMMNRLQRRVFAFGTHPQATADDEHPVTSAIPNGQKIRIIMDQLLAGNRLEEISCRGIVGPDGAFDRVPDGATPDDIALCSVAADVLPASCKGSHAVCVCQLDTGCADDMGNMIAKGKPVGVLDVNQDGAADATRFIKGVVGLKCGSIDVPIDINASYWTPSGFQQVPAVTGGIQAGFDLLGPAIVLFPEVAPGTTMPPGVLPTNTTCGLTFDPSVVNKRGEGVCAPAGGNPDTACTPGDVSLVTWKVEPLGFIPNSFQEGGTIASTDPLQLYVNAPLDLSTLSSITITRGGTAVTGFTVTTTMAAFPYALSLTITPPTAGFATGAYILTFPTALHDVYSQAPPAPIVFHFNV